MINSVLIFVYSGVIWALPQVVVFFFSKKNIPRPKWYKNVLVLLLCIVIFGAIACSFISFLLLEWGGLASYNLPVSFFWSCLYYSFLFCGVFYGQLELTKWIRKSKSGRLGVDNEHNEKEIIIKGDNLNTEIYKLKPSKIIFLESQVNDVEMFFWKDDGSLKNVTIRTTLKKIEEQVLSNSLNFYRCHRSFIINLTYIRKIKGNSRGGTAVLSDGSIIPVSRNKIGELKDIFKTL